MTNCVGAGYGIMDAILAENGGEFTVWEIEYVSSKNFKQMKGTIHLMIICFINLKKIFQQVHLMLIHWCQKVVTDVAWI